MVTPKLGRKAPGGNFRIIKTAEILRLLLHRVYEEGFRKSHLEIDGSSTLIIHLWINAFIIGGALSKHIDWCVENLGA